jgi:hypothetical protein
MAERVHPHPRGTSDESMEVRPIVADPKGRIIEDLK